SCVRWMEVRSMSPAPAAPAKVCIRCKRDCANRPRSKDPQGRYICQECLDAAKTSASSKAKPQTAAAADPDSPSDPIDLPAPAAAPIALAEEDAPPKPKAIPVIQCQACGHLCQASELFCTQCGAEPSTGKKLKSKEKHAKVRSLDRHAREKEMFERAA